MPTGQLLWKTDIGSAVFASPCLIGGTETGNQILVGCQKGTLHCLKSSDGAVQWVQPIGTGGISTTATPILSAKDVLKFLNAATTSVPKDCEESTEERNATGTLSCPEESVLDSDTERRGFDLRRLACCANSGTVAWLKTGQAESPQNGIVHCTTLGGDVFSSPVAFDGHIVVGCRDNHLYCLLDDSQDL